MNDTITSIKETGAHKPLVTGSNPVAATIKLKSSLHEKGIHQDSQTYLDASTEQGISIEEASALYYILYHYIIGN